MSIIGLVLAFPEGQREVPQQLRPVRQLKTKVGEQGPPPPPPGVLAGKPTKVPSPEDLKKFKEIVEKEGADGDKESLESAETFYHHFGYYPIFYHYPVYYPYYYYPYYYPYYSYWG